MNVFPLLMTSTTYKEAASAPFMLVNNTGLNFGAFEAELIRSLRFDKKLPEEFADLLTVEFITVEGQPRAILNNA